MIEFHIPYLAHVSIESVEGRTPDLIDKIPGVFLDATQCSGAIILQYWSSILMQLYSGTGIYEPIMLKPHGTPQELVL